MATPLLLLKPEGSRDRAGVVTPTLNGAVAVVAGQFGQAWEFSSGESVSIAGYAAAASSPGTLIVRARFVGTAAGTRYAALRGSSITLGQMAGGLFRYKVDSADRSSGGTAPSDAWLVMALRWDGLNAQAFINGLQRDTFAYTAGVAVSTTSAGFVPASDPVVNVEALLLFDRLLTASEIAALSEPHAWAWDSLADAPRPGLFLPT